jgi:hypothetical protein
MTSYADSDVESRGAYSDSEDSDSEGDSRPNDTYYIDKRNLPVMEAFEDRLLRIITKIGREARPDQRQQIESAELALDELDKNIGRDDTEQEYRDMVASAEARLRALETPMRHTALMSVTGLNAAGSDCLGLICDFA